MKRCATCSRRARTSFSSTSRTCRREPKRRSASPSRRSTARWTAFGYAHIVHSRPNGYPFLEELADVSARQISMESAQQKVDLSVLKSLSGKTLIVGVIDLADDSPVEDVETVAERIRDALRFVEPERLILAPDCGMKYLPRAKAFGKLSALSKAAAKVRAEL